MSDPQASVEAEEARRRAALAQRLVALAFRVPLGELLAASRRRSHVAFARQVSMYLAHTSAGLSLTDVGACFGRDRTTVSHACHLIEDRRDDPGFDAMLSEMETLVGLALAPEGGGRG